MNRVGSRTANIRSYETRNDVSANYRLANKVYVRCNKAVYRNVNKKIKTLNDRLNKILEGK